MRVGAIASALILLPIVIARVGIPVEVDSLREPLARSLAGSLARDVRIDGRPRLVLSLQPAVQVSGLRIGNPPGFDDEAFAVLGSARLQLDLLPLLRRRLVIRELAARDLAVRLVRRADGVGNWQHPQGLSIEPSAPTSAAVPVAEPDGPRSDTTSRLPLTSVSLDHLLLERIALTLVDDRGRERRFDLDRLQASAPGEAPLAVRIEGRVEQAFPYAVRIEGGPLSQALALDGRWPFALALSFAGTTAQIDGDVRGLLAPGPDGTRTDLRVELASDDLSQVERLLQTRLPAVGATRLAFRMRQGPGSLVVESIDGAMGSTTLAGEFRWDSSGPLPRLTGRLNLPTLDLRPFLGQPGEQPAPRHLLDTWRELAGTRIDLSGLRETEADLSISVGRWLSLPGDVRDALLELRLSGGRLIAPVQARVGDANLRGQLLADASGSSPLLRLQLATRASPVAELGRLLTGIDGLDGELARLDLTVQGRGPTLGAIMRNLSARLAVDGADLTYGNVAGGRPVRLRLDQLELALPARGELRGHARGALLEQPFAARLQGSDVDTLAREGRVRFDLRADASGARAALDGELRGLGSTEVADTSLSLGFSVAAARAGSVGRWFGLSPAAAVPFELRGRIAARHEHARLSDLALTLGRLRANGEARREGPEGERARWQSRLAIESIDVDELLTLLPPRPPRAPGTPSFETVLRLPLLPREVPLADVELDLSLGQGRSGRVLVEDLRWQGRLRNGAVAPAAVAFRLARVPFAGEFSADLRAALPEARLTLSTRDLEAGAMLERIGLAEGLDARVDELQAEAALRGSTVSELLAHSAFRATLRGGQWIPRSSAGTALARLTLERGELELPPGQPLTLSLGATVGRTPLDLRLRSGRLAQLVRPGADLPITLRAAAADSTLELEGIAQAPLGRAGGALTLRARGPRLDRLDRLTGVSLPPWGPWSLQAGLSATPAGYRLESLQVATGTTRLEGRGGLDLSTVRPRVELDLRATTLQLDDFPTAGWAAAHRPAPAPTATPASTTGEAAGRVLDEAAHAAREGQRVLSRAALLRQDARIRVAVDQVRSGTDRLGHGALALQLDSARLRLDPLRVTMPGGEAYAAIDYEPLPGDRDVRVTSRVRIDRFDYGVLARRLRPDTPVNGRFSVHADLASTAPLDRLLARGDGRIDFAVWPIDLRAGLFDLWAVNVFVAMLPALDPAAASRINCAVGRFDLRGGELREERMVVDSTRLRARGRARVDLRDGSLAIRLQPTPKQAQFFSLRTPVEVTGRVDDFRVGLPAGSIPATVARFVGSLFTTPIEWLLRDPLPADGADVCEAPMRPAPAQVSALR